MDKLPNYNGTIDLISGLRAKNNGDFPLMQAHDVQATETQRLDEMFKNPESWLPVYNGENEGGAEGGGTGGGNYVLELTGESGTLTDEQYQAVVDNFPNVTIVYNGTTLDLLKSGVPSAGMYAFMGLMSIGDNQLSNMQIAINNDKTFLVIQSIITIPTSSGGLTKTKVTLAELQAMLTEENVGAIVEIIPKQIVLADETMQYFVASGLLPIECVISRTQSGYSILKSNSLFTYKDETTYTINQLNIGLFKDLGGNTILALYRVITVANGNVSYENTDMVENVSDDVFDFYIYK